MVDGSENSHFYFYEGNEDENKGLSEGALRIPKTRESNSVNKKRDQLKVDTKVDRNREFSAASTIEMTSTESLLGYKDNLNNLENILKFPIESSHAYSYAHLSPNSLALRLNVLKRSLEILKDRPVLLKSIKKGQEEMEDHFQGRARLPSQISNAMMDNRSSLYTHSSANNSQELFNDKYRMQSNASSAALAALFRPQMKRSDSLPINQLYSNKEALPSRKGPSNLNPFLNDDLNDIINLLQEDRSQMMDNSEIVSTLHNISLSTYKSDQAHKQDIIKNKLLYALSTPFVESAGITSSLLGATPETINNYPSSFNFSNPPTPQISNTGNRPFHAIYSGKHTLPPSIFTIETDDPWSIKAANDLACLMFGVSKNTIKALNIMDLIAPQFRNFVFEKLLGKSLRYTNHDDSTNNIIFAGEIVAISRRGGNDFAWTSMWAKKKGDLIICMFDQIPCDAFDVILTGSVDSGIEQSLSVKSVRNIAGQLVDGDNLAKYKTIDNISETMDKDVKSTRNSKKGREVVNAECKKLNQARYYTLQINDVENIPCAVTSYPLEEKDSAYELKLRVHSLPYIAGIFVLDAKTLKMLSWNNAIAKNLFGRGGQDLQDQSINYLIPKFEKILKTGLEEYKEEFEVVPGLVLPEHFFRRYDTLLQYREGKCSSHEDIFFNSHGVEALHRDGKAIHVDVQLRVSSSDIFVLWITYSRSSNKSNISKELDRLNSEKASSMKHLSTEAESPTRRSMSQNRKASTVKLPSQLELFASNEEGNFEFAPSGNEISRKSSTRKPKSETLGIPISRFNNSGSIVSAVKSLRLRDVSNSSDANTLHTSRRSSTDSDATSVSEADNSKDRDIGSDHKHAPYIKYSEDEILRLEKEELAGKLRKSDKWPREVGAFRRTKQFSEFKVLQEMGEGAYGKVLLAQHKDDKEYKIIIKCIDKERILVDTWVRDRKLGTIPSEIQVMAFLNNEPHPNIMRILDFFEDPKYYYLETPIFGDPPGIDLFDYIEIKKDMSEMECRFIFKQIVSAVYHLHKHGIVHRDIKDENIIVEENGIIKLIDFGSAGYVRSGPFDVFVGTIDYASPEVLRGEKYEGKPQDVWALGILLYTMLYKENPFYNVDEIMEGDLRFPYIISESSTKLMKKILVREVKDRPIITDIVEDEWLDIQIVDFN